MVIDGYKEYMKMPYDRPTWDLLSIIYLTEPELFTASKPGKVTVTADGYTVFTPDDNGNVVWLTCTDQQLKEIDRYIMDTISRKPKKFKNN